MTKKNTPSKEPQSGSPAPASGGIQIGILGRNTQSFEQTHRTFIESLKKAVEAKGARSHFYGLSGGSDCLSSNGASGDLRSVAGVQSLFFPSANYGLPSRDLVADQIEMLVHEESLDGLILVPWSISSVVGMLMALARLGTPAVFLPNYSVWSQALKQQGAHYSQASMLLLLEVMGFARMGSVERAFLDEKKIEAAVSFEEDLLKWGGQKIVEMTEQKVSSRRFLAPGSFNNCVAVDCALGGCSDTLLHLSAVAQEAGVPFSISVLNGSLKSVPVLASFNQQGEFSLKDLAEAGGTVGLLGACAQFLEPSPTVGGKNITDLAKAAASMRSAFKLSHASKKTSSLTALNGNLARDGALCRTVGIKEQQMQGSGSVKVFNSEKACCDAILSKKIKKGDVVVLRYCGPKGSPGMPALTDLKSALEKKGMDDGVVILTDGRIPPIGKMVAVTHISPEAASGSTLAILQDGDVVQWNFVERSITARLTETEIRVRLSRWKEPERPKKNSYLSRYSKYSSPTIYGAALV